MRRLETELRSPSMSEAVGRRRTEWQTDAARVQRDADTTPAAAAFERDSFDVFSKLARCETSIERSLYRALQKL